MDRSIFLLLAFLLSTDSIASAQDCKPIHDIQAFVQTWNDAVIGPGSRSHRCTLSMLAPDARITGVIRNQDGSSTRNTESPEEFVGWYQKHASETFWERTLHSSVEVYENVARITRTYEVRSSPTSPVTSTGIEDFQLIREREGGEWEVFSLLWQDASPDRPLPPRYLPQLRPGKAEKQR